MKVMRTFLPILALATGLMPWGHGETATSDGARDLVPLPGWAAQNGFKLTWVKPNETFTLTGQAATLALKIDSMLAEINGVNVWLCEPIALRHGEACISRLDLKTAIEPILFPQTDHAGARLHTICLDPGHGGKDTGGVFDQYEEKRYTLPLAQELAGQLAEAGFDVILTRTNDYFVELENRPALANRENASLFISLHFNIGVPGEAHGAEVYCLTPAKADSTNAGGRGGGMGAAPGNHCDDRNVFLAYQLQKALVQNLPVEDRGLRRARFAVLRTARMPAVLIEGGFLTDAAEQAKIADPKYRRQLAAAIVKGVLAYQRLLKS